MALSNILLSLLIALLGLLASAMAVFAGVFTFGVLAIFTTLASRSVDAFLADPPALFWPCVTRLLVFSGLCIVALLAPWHYRKRWSLACEVASETARRERDESASRKRLCERVEANLNRLEGATKELQTAEDRAVQAKTMLLAKNKRAARQHRRTTKQLRTTIQHVVEINKQAKRNNDFAIEELKKSHQLEMANLRAAHEQDIADNYTLRLDESLYQQDATLESEHTTNQPAEQQVEQDVATESDTPTNEQTEFTGPDPTDRSNQADLDADNTIVNEQEATEPRDPAAERRQHYKGQHRTPCKYYMKSLQAKCKNPNCTWYHPEDCRYPTTCGIDGCKLRHAPLCVKNLKNVCTWGDECKFWHPDKGENDGRFGGGNNGQRRR